MSYNHTLPNHYKYTFEACNLTLLSEFIGSKKHHQLKCNVCQHVFTATPISKHHNFKLWSTGGCPTCTKARKYAEQAPNRGRILSQLQDRGVTSLDGYDGSQHSPHTLFRLWKNSVCGHEFRAQVSYLIHGSAGSPTDCTVCGRSRRAEINAKRNIEKSAEWAKFATERTLYYSIVNRCTVRSYTNYKSTINPNNHRRVLAGDLSEDGYQLDHIISRAFGFEMGIDPRLIGSHENLQMLPWVVNLKKKARVDGTYQIPHIFATNNLINTQWVKGPYDQQAVLAELVGEIPWWYNSVE